MFCFISGYFKPIPLYKIKFISKFSLFVQIIKVNKETKEETAKCFCTYKNHSHQLHHNHHNHHNHHHENGIIEKNQELEVKFEKKTYSLYDFGIDVSELKKKIAKTANNAQTTTQKSIEYPYLLCEHFN